jgi:phage baseplate assembly protein W
MPTILKGIAFPFQRGVTSFPKVAEGDQAVAAQIEALITTTVKERVERPDVGINAYEFIFDKITPIMRARLASDLARQIRDKVPRAKVEAIDVYTVPGQNEQTQLFVALKYSVAGTTMTQQIPVNTTGTP